MVNAIFYYKIATMKVTIFHGVLNFKNDFGVFFGKLRLPEIRNRGGPYWMATFNKDTRPFPVVRKMSSNQN